MVIARLLIVVLVAFVIFDPQAALAQSQKQPTAVGTGGAAASVDLDGTRAAIQALRDGGNAVDAAVAAASVLGVTEPYSCGIGGGGFMVIRTAKGKVTTIDGREESPATMRPDSFWENGTPLPFNDARFSGISAGIPGTPATWAIALRRYGTWSFGRALRPGIRVARDGFTVDSTFASQTEPNVDWFDDIPSTAAIYLDPDGTPRDVGTTLQNPDLARTYRQMRRNGVDWFYRGPVADAMADAAQHPPKAASANHAWRPGLMTTRRPEALQRDRASADAHRLPRPRRLEYGPADERRVHRRRGAQHPRGLSGACRRRTACGRCTSCSRRRASPSPTATPTWPTRTSSTCPSRACCPTASPPSGRALIDEDHAATSPVAPGDPYDNQKGDASKARARPARRSATRASRRRTWSCRTAKGNVVSYTFTIESTGGNAIVVPGYGFLMNNELTDFNFDSTTHPNRADGDKRPRSSMSPTIVTKDGEPFIAVGSPGGSTIPGTVLQVLFERLDLGKTLPEAIATPRATQRNGATTTAEPAFINSPEGQALLRARSRVHLDGRDRRRHRDRVPGRRPDARGGGAGPPRRRQRRRRRALARERSGSRAR